jgi:hypothetical protein
MRYSPGGSLFSKRLCLFHSQGGLWPLAAANDGRTLLHRAAAARCMQPFRRGLIATFLAGLLWGSPAGDLLFSAAHIMYTSRHFMCLFPIDGSAGCRCHAGAAHELEGRRKGREPALPLPAASFTSWNCNAMSIAYLSKQRKQDDRRINIDGACLPACSEVGSLL